MYEIIPISTTTIDWQTFLNLVKMTLGSDPTRELEEKKVTIKNIGHFCRILENAGFDIHNVCDCVYYGFLIISTKEQLFELLQTQNILNMTVKEISKKGFYLGLLTATVSDLVLFVLRNSTGGEAIELRVLANKLNEFLNKEGFNRLFWAYNKQLMPDSTVRLEAR